MAKKMNEDVIPLNEIGKIKTVKVYNQAYVDKQQERIEELEKENEKLMQMLASSADCETCKHYDEDLEKEDKEPCKNCFYDNSFWELKED